MRETEYGEYGEKRRRAAQREFEGKDKLTEMIKLKDDKS